MKSLYRDAHCSQSGPKAYNIWRDVNVVALGYKEI